MSVVVGLRLLLKKLSRQRFSCTLDANKALEAWLKAHDFVDIASSEIIEHPIFKRRGRPKLEQTLNSYEYQITAILYCQLNVREQQLSEKGLFMLASNDMSETLTVEKMLGLYK